jgi:hypothetical protein
MALHEPCRNAHHFMVFSCVIAPGTKCSFGLMGAVRTAGGRSGSCTAPGYVLCSTCPALHQVVTKTLQGKESSPSGEERHENLYLVTCATRVHQDANHMHAKYSILIRTDRQTSSVHVQSMIQVACAPRKEPKAQSQDEKPLHKPAQRTCICKERPCLSAK